MDLKYIGSKIIETGIFSSYTSNKMITLFKLKVHSSRNPTIISKKGSFASQPKASLYLRHFFITDHEGVKLMLLLFLVKK